ncbi:MAG: hypothetical protein HY271_06725 [Deltaproteobacteria bacterium]|nr:hypothetical protein [Deltaproteobacteria bacterium]
MELALALGYLTGLRFLAPYPLDLPSVLATGAVVNTCDAIMCRLVARNNGYPPRLWTALGLVFGIWAVAVCILLPKRAESGR